MAQSQGRVSDVGQTTLKMQISEVEETEANIDIGQFFASWRSVIFSFPLFFILNCSYIDTDKIVDDFLD